MAWPKYKSPEEVFGLWKTGSITKQRIQTQYYDNLRLKRVRVEFWATVLDMIKNEEDKNED